jgi:hypothetical protein
VIWDEPLTVPAGVSSPVPAIVIIPLPLVIVIEPLPTREPDINPSGCIIDEVVINISPTLIAFCSPLTFETTLPSFTNETEPVVTYNSPNGFDSEPKSCIPFPSEVASGIIEPVINCEPLNVFEPVRA